MWREEEEGRFKRLLLSLPPLLFSSYPSLSPSLSSLFLIRLLSPAAAETDATPRRDTAAMIEIVKGERATERKGGKGKRDSVLWALCAFFSFHPRFTSPQRPRVKERSAESQTADKSGRLAFFCTQREREREREREGRSRMAPDCCPAAPFFFLSLCLSLSLSLSPLCGVVSLCCRTPQLPRAPAKAKRDERRRSGDDRPFFFVVVVLALSACPLCLVLPLSPLFLSPPSLSPPPPLRPL